MAGGPRRLVKRAFDTAVGSRPRRVRVLSGVARGKRLELDLTREKWYWLGLYERPLQEFLRRTIRPGDVVYDIGAHHGFVSVCAASLGAKVFAFEPVPANVERLRRNVAALAVEVVELAMWDDERGVQLVGGDTDFESHAEAGGTTPTATVDGFAQAHPPPTLLKIDVEGAEARVLRGAARVLREQKPIVVCEVHGDGDVSGLLPGYEIRPLGGSQSLIAVPSGDTLNR